MYIVSITRKHDLDIVEIGNKRYVKCRVRTGGWWCPISDKEVYHVILLNNELKRVGWWMNQKIKRLVHKYKKKQSMTIASSYDRVHRESITAILNGVWEKFDK